MIGQGNTETDRNPNFIPTFELRAEQDKDATLKAGHFVARDVEWCVMIKKGTGATTPEKIARLMKDQTRWPIIKPYYDAWKANMEAPVDGFPLADWPAITRGQVETLRQLHIRSVQDLAGANDAALMRIGMGGMALKQKAQAWLASAEGPGKAAEEIAALKAESEADKQRIKGMEADIAELRGALERLQPRDMADTRRGGRKVGRTFAEEETAA